ncbi:ROK family transcriptional regulator [Wukongibacter baidiensis]|uniref:ROK family transcriptional regulator n=1 Tax=Wukongibacter baidiensis TaxID=1723361 RepID=UPI003D7F6D9E
MKKRTNSILKEMNRSILLSKILEYEEYEGISRIELSKQANLSKSTVSLIIEELISSGLIKEVGEGNSTKKGGRKPIKIKLNPYYGYILSIKVKKNISTYIISNLFGEVFTEEIIENCDCYGDELVERIANNCKALISKNSDLDIIAISMSIPGNVDSKNGSVLFSPEIRLNNCKIREYFNENTNIECDVYVENDVNMTIIGEKWKGKGRNYKDFALVMVGSGVGCSMVLNDKIYRGSNGFAGEIGYMVLSKNAINNEYSTLDKFGYFEGKTSMAALLEKLELKDIKEINKKLENADVEVSVEVEKIIDYLSIGIANITSLLNPEVVILSGSILNLKDHILGPLRDRVGRLTPLYCDIEASELPNGWLYGSVLNTLSALYDIKLI